MLVSMIGFSFACKASPPFAMLDTRIISIEFVAMNTMSLFRVDGCWANPPKNILFMAHHLKMSGINAPPVAAKMIKFFILWNRTNK